jgi:hypothetical protein
MMAPDPHKIFFDDESYNDGHGHAYDVYGINPGRGAVVVVRPDQCKATFLPRYLQFEELTAKDVSLVVDSTNIEAVGRFFHGWARQPAMAGDFLVRTNL